MASHSSPRSTAAELYDEDDYKHFHDTHVHKAEAKPALTVPKITLDEEADPTFHQEGAQPQFGLLTEPKQMAMVFVSACLHATAFALAVTLMYHQTLEVIIRTELTAAAAYVWDLLCAAVFNVIPFSRARHTKDIALHHIPILAVISLSLPHYTSSAAATVMTPFLARSVSFGFLSCLNECIMCVQRLGVGTSFPAVVAEYSYKLFIFSCAGWLSALSSLLHVYHCVSSDEVVLDFPLILNLMACTGTAVFIVSNYPSMGWRSFKKAQMIVENGPSGLKVSLSSSKLQDLVKKES